MAFKIALASLIVLVLTACSADAWTGFVYPDRSDLSVDISVGEHPSLSECQEAVRALIRVRGWDNADYICGLNCRPWEENTEITRCEVKAR